MPQRTVSTNGLSLICSSTKIMSIIDRRRSMCNDQMPVSVKVYYGQPTSSTVEIRRFVFRPEQHKTKSTTVVGIFQALVERIRSVFNGINLHDLHLCWKDDDGDYVVFSSDDELRVAISNTNDNTLRIYIREKDLLTHPVRNGSVNDVDPSGYARISRRIDQSERESQRRHHRRSTRSASASRDSEISSPPLNQRRPINHINMSKEEDIDRLQLHEIEHTLIETNGGASSDFVTMKHMDSGTTSTSSGVVEESSETMKESSTTDQDHQFGQESVAVCSECRGEGRRGVLYRCTVCQDFFLCSECENRGLHDQHIMLRIRSGLEPLMTTINRR